MNNPKEGFNYRIGTTSYIYPEDILGNVRKLKDKVDDIELLCFEQGYSVAGDELDELKQIGDSYALTYTIHMPLDIGLGSPEEIVRLQAVNEVKRIIKESLLLDPYAYILHINFNNDCDWKKNVRYSLKSIIESTSVDSCKICVENLNYPLEELDKVISSLNLSICLDIGHLIGHKYNIEEYFKRYFVRTRVIHLYGICDKSRHVSLNNVGFEIINWLKSFLESKKYDGILTLEVFSVNDFTESMEMLTGKKSLCRD